MFTYNSLEIGLVTFGGFLRKSDHAVLESEQLVSEEMNNESKRNLNTKRRSRGGSFNLRELRLGSGIPY